MRISFFVECADTCRGACSSTIAHFLKFIAPADPATRWTAAHRGPAFFAYSANYLVDADNAIIVDVEATTAIRQAEILAVKRMIERLMACFDLYPARLIGDSAYGSAEMLDWLVQERGIEPHIPVFDKSQRTDGTFSRDDFTYDHTADTYRCPAGKTLQHYRRRFAMPRTGIMKDNSMRYRASKRDCQACPLKPRCCPGHRRAKSRGQSMKGRATWPARSPRPRPIRPRGAGAKRSRCCSLTSNAF